MTSDASVRNARPEVASRPEMDEHARCHSQNRQKERRFSDTEQALEPNAGPSPLARDRLDWLSF
jgi:hypothetical protein